MEGRDHSKATCPHLEHAQGWKKWVELRLSKTVQRGYSPPDVARISYSEYGFGYNYYSKIPTYPIFHLLKGNMDVKVIRGAFRSLGNFGFSRAPLASMRPMF